jgi:serine/threonine-protein kinase
VKTNYLGLGYVVYTDPRARSQAPKGSTITLYVV